MAVAHGSPGSQKTIIQKGITEFIVESEAKPSDTVKRFKGHLILKNANTVSFQIHNIGVSVSWRDVRFTEAQFYLHSTMSFATSLTLGKCKTPWHPYLLLLSVSLRLRRAIEIHILDNRRCRPSRNRLSPNKKCQIYLRHILM